MTISTLASGKASAFGNRSWSKVAVRLYSTSSTAPAAATNPTSSKATDAAHQRDLFVNVLNANATRRDAKQYLARFKRSQSEPSSVAPSSIRSSVQSRQSGVNRGALHGPTRAIAENPEFAPHRVDVEAATAPKETIHLALVVLRAPQALDDATLDGVALTLSQLVQLDMRIVLVLDCYEEVKSSAPRMMAAKHLSKVFNRQGKRLSAAINSHSHEGARLVDGSFEAHTALSSATDSASKVSVGVPDLLFRPLKQAVIPIVPTLAYTPSGQLVSCSASSIMKALTFALSGLPASSGPQSDSGLFITSLDRIILLDGLGGIPSKARGDHAHVFINLDQEFADIKHELTEYARTAVKNSSELPNVYEQHLSNLQMLQDCLSMLPPASSALIVTPEEAASSSKGAISSDHTIGTGTRRQKNTLIHNLLTNKPMVSSSLPAARLPSSTASNGNSITTPEPLRSTLIKRGMSLTIIPNPSRGEGWQPPITGGSSLDLGNDPGVDVSRLTHLIEDSFRRKLDLQHYLARIHGRTAGLIVAGSYDGGAILTWEQPPGTAEPSRLVPYLDKFAVLSSSQGSAGVADILFQAMVRTCFPHGVCWRSRKDNPVNKWYFERADGHWQIPGTNWTMFWTGAGVVESKQRWEDYVAVCSNIEASWKEVERPD